MWITLGRALTSWPVIHALLDGTMVTSCRRPEASPGSSPGTPGWLLGPVLDPGRALSLLHEETMVPSKQSMDDGPASQGCGVMVQKGSLASPAGTMFVLHVKGHVALAPQLAGLTAGTAQAGRAMPCLTWKLLASYLLQDCCHPHWCLNLPAP